MQTLEVERGPSSEQGHCPNRFLKREKKQQGQPYALLMKNKHMQRKHRGGWRHLETGGGGAGASSLAQFCLIPNSLRMHVEHLGHDEGLRALRAPYTHSGQ